MTSASLPLRPAAAQALSAQLDKGYALPTEWYGDPEIFKAELERIHRKSWRFAAHTGELKEPGDVLPLTVARTPIVLVRDKDGSVRGFLNICRHRNYPVVTEAGNRNALFCHYHGWTYELDGALRHAPRSAGEPEFDKACFGLRPIQTRVWGPMIWVNIDLEAPSFDSWIEGMPELVKERGLTVEDHVFGFDNTWDINANWKVFQDNTIECYHCPTTHPEFARAVEMKPELQEMWVGGKYWIHHRIPFRDGIDEGITYLRKPGQPFYYYYHWIFPTTYMQFSGRGFDIGTIDVVDVDRIRFRHICFLPPTTPPEILAKGKAQLEKDATIWQDVDICNKVQAGHDTGLAPQGRFLASPEFLLTHLQRTIVEMMSAPPDAA